MILTYYTLYLILFDQMISSRVSVSNSYKKKLDGNCVVKTIQTVGFFLIFGLIAVNIIFLIFSMTSQVDNEIDLFDKMFVATFGFVAFWFLLSILVIYCRLSGQPFTSKKDYENTKYISIIFMLWTGAFLVKIIIYMIFANKDPGKTLDYDFWNALFSILLSIVTDMVPYFSILELKFIEIFKNNATQLWKKSSMKSSGSRLREDNVTETALNDNENLID